MRKIVSITSALSVAVLALAVASPGPALAQEVQGPKVSWKYNVWGKRRAFTEALGSLREVGTYGTLGRWLKGDAS